MPDPTPIDTPTVRLHKRQLAWQILVPFLVVTVFLLAAAVLLVLDKGDRTRVWADVSIIWLLLPILFFALAAAAVLILMIVGMAKLLGVIPRFTSRVQQVAGQVAGGTRKVADGVAKPFIWFEQAGATIKSIFKL